AARGSLALYVDRANPQLILREGAATSAGKSWRVERLTADAPWQGAIVAAARDGRELGRASVSLAAGERESLVNIDLPLALRNDIAALSIEHHASAGAVRLADARDRRAL